MGPLPDMKGAFIMLGIMCAVAGWGVIEFVLWVFSHLAWIWS